LTAAIAASKKIASRLPRIPQLSNSSIFSRRFAGFLFDMDGTIINSFAATQRAWGAWAHTNKIDPESFIHTMHGVRGVDLIGGMGLPHLDPAEESAKVLAAEMADVEGIVPIPGAINFLGALPPLAWAVVTSAPRDLAFRRLRAAGITPPNIMVTAEDVAIGKPDPACFRLGAERLGVRPQDCLVFEDAHAGVTAGELAGASIMVVTATHDLMAHSHHAKMTTYETLSISTNEAGWISLVQAG
jgi:mannitol-1-/sugar-/sorbitol-6-phosphatase